jgi:hypothetical protein
MTILSIKKSSKQLADWDIRFGYAIAAGILDNWKRQPFAKSFSALSDNADAHRGLLQTFIRQIEPFDCLQIAGWEPDENQLSDVIAALFSPNWGHPFHVRILRHVLEALVASGSLSAVKYAKIENTLDPNRTQLFVRRERRGDSSRADLDVYTRGPDAFLVRIEPCRLVTKYLRRSRVFPRDWVIR